MAYPSFFFTFVHVLKNLTSHQDIKNQIYLRKVRDLRHSGCHNFVHFSGRKKYLSPTECFLFNRKPSVITLAFTLSFRFSNVRHWVATLVVAAGDLGTRGKVLKKLIELADVLSDKLGNLVSFMAVMEGLSLPQVLFRRVSNGNNIRNVNVD